MLIRLDWLKGPWKTYKYLSDLSKDDLEPNPMSRIISQTHECFTWNYSNTYNVTKGELEFLVLWFIDH